MNYLSIVLLLVSFASMGQTSIEKSKMLFEEKKYAEAEKILKVIGEKSSGYAEARYYLGRVAYEKKDYHAAMHYFEEATNVNKQMSEYFVWLGNMYGLIAQNANVFRQGLLAPKMKKALESAIALDSKNVDARSSLIQYYLEAPGIMGGSVDKAREVAKQILAIEPAEGHKQMGNIYLHEKHNVNAENEYLEMVKLNPDYVSVLASFYVGQKRYDRAFILLEEVVTKNPPDYVSIYQFGKASAISGQRMDRGEECLKKYLGHEPQQNEPSRAGANMRLGQIIEKKGNKVEAKKYFEAALKLDGSLKEAKEGLERCGK